MKLGRLLVTVLLACACTRKSDPPSPGAAERTPPPAADRKESPDAPAEPLEADTANPQTDEWDVMRLQTLEVEGPRSGDDIIAAARMHADDLIGCYQEFAKEDPDLKGELALRLLVTPRGEVTDVLIHNNKLPNHRVGTCMLPLVKQWKLRANEDTEPTKVVLPMEFFPPQN